MTNSEKIISLSTAIGHLIFLKGKTEVNFELNLIDQTIELLKQNVKAAIDAPSIT